MESRRDFIDEEPGSETSEPPEHPPNEGAPGSGDDEGAFPDGGPESPGER